MSTPAPRRVRDLGYVIDGRVRKSWPFGGLPRKTKGLYNPSNLCYRNAVLQCLLHTPEFYRYLDDNEKRCARKGDNCVFCALRALALAYWSNGSDESLSENQQAARRYRALAKVNTAMNRHREPGVQYSFLRPQGETLNDMNNSGQHDAQEYFMALTNMLKYINDFRPRPPPTGLPPVRNIAINRLFNLRKMVTWTCKDCGKIHKTRAKDAGINLPMPNNGGTRRDLDWYLERYFADDTREGLKCETDACKIKIDGKEDHKRGDRVRSIRIVGGPEILVIQLMRTRWDKDYNPRKITDRVQYSDRLDLSRYTSGEDPLTYQLNGVVAHGGKTLDSGHYVAMVRSQRGDGFVLCNDDTIDDELTKAQVFAHVESKAFQSYLLFYQKIGGKMAKCI